MSGFSDVAYLVKTTYESGKNGRQERNESRRRVFVNPFSLSSSSFATADAEGMRPRHVLQLRAADYDGEEEAEYNGERLSVTSAVKTGREYVRLTLSQKVADDGA